MELELKYLAPYLPYGLKVIPNGSKQATRILGITFNPENLTIVRYGEIRESKIALKWVKPILRPLADCLKDLNNDEFLCIDSCDVTYSKLHSGKEAFKIYPVQAEWIFTTDVYENFYEYLFINHFDVFGLIDAGLAIDINSLNP